MPRLNNQASEDFFSTIKLEPFPKMDNQPSSSFAHASSPSKMPAKMRSDTGFTKFCAEGENQVVFCTRPTMSRKLWSQEASGCLKTDGAKALRCELGAVTDNSENL